jgi:hypothetical protein
MQDLLHLMASPEHSPMFLHESRIRMSNAGKVNNTSRGDIQRFNAGSVWLKLSQSLGADHCQPFDAICRSSPMEFFQAGKFIHRSRHDNLAAAFIGNVMLLTKGDERLRAGNTSLSLE